MKKPDTCTVLAMQCLESLKSAPPEKRQALLRRARVWLALAKEKQRTTAPSQKH